MSVEQLFEEQAKSLTTAERLQLATLLLNSIAPKLIVDDSEEWSEEDMHDATLYSLRHAAKSFGEE